MSVPPPTVSHCFILKGSEGKSTKIICPPAFLVHSDVDGERNHPHSSRKKSGQILVSVLISNTSCIKEKCPLISTRNKWLQYAMSLPAHICSCEFPTFPGWTIGLHAHRICRMKESSSLFKINVFYTLELSLLCPISYRKDQIYRNFYPVILPGRRAPFQAGTQAVPQVGSSSPWVAIHGTSVS